MSDTEVISIPSTMEGRRHQFNPVLTEQEIKRLHRFGTVRQYARGVRILEAGHTCFGMILTLKGTVTICKYDGLGNTSLLSLIDIFWVVYHALPKPAVDDDAHPLATVQAHRDLLAAVRRRDPVLAQQRMREHFRNIEIRFGRALEVSRAGQAAPGRSQASSALLGGRERSEPGAPVQAAPHEAKRRA